MHHLETIDGKGGTVKYSFPGSYAECSVRQLGAIAVLMGQGLAEAQHDELAETHMRLRLLHELTDMPDNVFAAIEPSDLLSLRPDELDVQRVAFLPQLDWAIAPPVFHTSLLPELTMKGATWLGPRDKLGNYTVKRWGFCDALTKALSLENADETSLNNLLGALYHPADEAWNNADIEERGALLGEHLHPATKLAAVLNYRGLRAWLAQAYPRCFRGSGSEDRHGMRGMVVELAGEKFGTVENAYNADLHDVMVYVEKSIDERDKQQHG